MQLTVDNMKRAFVFKVTNVWPELNELPEDVLNGLCSDQNLFQGEGDFDCVNTRAIERAVNKVTAAFEEPRYSPKD